VQGSDTNIPLDDDRARLITFLDAVQRMVEQSRAVEQLGCALLESGDQPLHSGGCRVITGGRPRILPTSDVDDFVLNCGADLILDVRNRQLQVGHNGGQSDHTLAWAVLMPLRVGMAWPGQPFGNRTIGRRFPGIKLTPRSLSRHITEITKAIQGGGTEGPYLYRVRVDSNDSDTLWGYQFSTRWRYVVVES
jgi:hypothetical protein